MKSEKKPLKCFGFTFIELLVVISIVTLLSVVVVANYRTFSSKRTVRNVAEELKGYLVLAQKSAQAGKKLCEGVYLGTEINVDITPPIIGCEISSLCEGDADPFLECKFSDQEVSFGLQGGSNPLEFDISGIPNDIFILDVSKSDSSETWTVSIDTSGMIDVSKKT